jgi:hypothetical protein
MTQVGPEGLEPSRFYKPVCGCPSRAVGKLHRVLPWCGMAARMESITDCSSVCCICASAVIPNTVSLVPGCVARLKHTPPCVFSSCLSMFAQSGMNACYLLRRPAARLFSPTSRAYCVLLGPSDAMAICRCALGWVNRVKGGW